MKYLFIFILAVVCSCTNGPFINHKLKFEKLGDCTNGEKIITMKSNIAGERYEFESCLDANFDGTTYAVERKGDTLVVTFQRQGDAKAAFNIKLDIDAFPVYNFISIDGKEAIAIRQTEK